MSILQSVPGDCNVCYFRSLAGKYDTKSRRCHEKHFRQLITVQTMQPQAEAEAKAKAETEAMQQYVSEIL